jgi:hypothetical protein
MSASPDFYFHTNLLHDSLSRLLGRSAVEASPGLMVGTGLLKPRPAQEGYYRPRLVVVSGLASAVGHLINETVDDDLLVAGTARDNDADTDINYLYAAHPGFAKDMLKFIDLEAEEVVKHSHLAHIARPERISAAHAYLLHTKISQKLNLSHPT